MRGAFDRARRRSLDGVCAELTRQSAQQSSMISSCSKKLTVEDDPRQQISHMLQQDSPTLVQPAVLATQ
ncbi:hypothetical protein J6590_014341 [Homalodisca vitripennis]|nr:hypothetical protein J6590_014341 [Homalodisca vitripennis]